MATNLNLKELKKTLLKKSLPDFIREFWDTYETDKLQWHWSFDYGAECFMWSVKHFLPEWITRDWLSDKQYEALKKKYNAHCPVRDAVDKKGNPLHRHDWNIPPRHGKSSVFNVMGPAWVSILTPIKIASVSHTAGLSGEMNTKRLRLLTSSKFQYYFGDEVGFKQASATSIELKSSSKLYSVCQTSFTGFGADVILADDLISSDNAEKDAKVLANTIKFFRNTLPTRLNNQTTGVIWQIQQRLGEGDISGVIRADKRLYDLYSHTVIRAEFDKDENLICPCTGKIIQLKKGDVLWRERFGDYSEARIQLGNAFFETQYNQDPAYSSVSIINDDFIHYLDKPTEVQEFKNESEIHYASHDCPVKGLETSDYHGYCEGYGKGALLLIDRAWEKHLGYVDEKQLFKDIELVDPSVIQVVEDKANGSALVQDLRGEVAGLVTFQPGTRSKEQRLALASNYMKNGSVVFAKNEETDYLIQQLKKFPMVEHDDIVDAFSQLVLYHFTSRKMGVYTNAFTTKNIIEPPQHGFRERIFYDYACSKVGEQIKLLACLPNPRLGTYVVEKEWVFTSTQEFIDFCKQNITKGELIIDASTNNAIYTEVYGMIRIIQWEDLERDASIALLKAGFFREKVLVSKTCGGTIGDIMKVRVTTTSREAGVDKMASLNEGYAGCLRAIIEYRKSTSGIW